MTLREVGSRPDADLSLPAARGTARLCGGAARVRREGGHATRLRHHPWVARDGAAAL